MSSYPFGNPRRRRPARLAFPSFALTALATSLALSPTLPADPGPAQDVVTVTHDKKKFRSDDPPDGIGEWPIKAIREWAAWVNAAEYEMLLSDDQRFLLVYSGRKHNDEHKLARETIEMVDEVIRPPGGEPRVKAIPENADPETVRDGEPLGAVTMVLVRVEEEADMATLCHHVATIGAGLDRWADGGARRTSFRLQRPLSAAWLVLPEGYEEDLWQPENELTHNLVRLCQLREYGQQPNWLGNGLAWYVEEELHSSIYCMPNRNDSFVEVKEHRSWEKRLRDLHEDRKAPVKIEELTALSLGTWDNASALRAWGAVRYLALYHADALPLILEELRGLWETKGVVTNEDGSWYRQVGFEVSPEDQAAVLVKHAGDEVFEEMNLFFQKGKKYRP